MVTVLHNHFIICPMTFCKGERYNIDIDLRARKFKPGEGGYCDKVGDRYFPTHGWIWLNVQRPYQLQTRHV